MFDTQAAYSSDHVDDYFYGQATDDGAYDDVEMQNVGAPSPGASLAGFGASHLAVLLVVGSLAALWVMGAAIFKGSNQS